MQKYFRKTAKIGLILVYLVIIAGAVVRMTGSGMGCPDWPKCFGYYIPPTDAETLQWQKNRDFEQGQVIIYNETLKVANGYFTTTDTYNSDNWDEYTKHDYAIFNVSHTWVEYINRLCGALAGLATLILAVFSFSYWKKQKLITILSWLVVFGMGFQAWLGATVVYSVLEPVKITVHMVMALVIVAILLFIIYKTSIDNKIKNIASKKIQLLFIVSLIATLLQVVLGTQVRQYIDHQSDIYGEFAKEQWLNNPTIQFYIHRSFSILVTLLNLYLAFYIYKFKLGFRKIKWVLILLAIEILSGITMYYLDFPFGSQALHLVIASLLFGVQFYLILETIKANQSLKTL